MRHWFVTSLTAGLLVATAAVANEEPVDHRATIRLYPDSGRVAVTDVIRHAGQGGLHFHLVAGLEVSAVRADGRPVAVTGTGPRFRVRLPAGTKTLAIDYGGDLPTEAGRSHRAMFLGPEGGLLPYGVDWLPRFGRRPLNYRIAIDTPKGQRAVAFGKLVEERRTETGWRAVFKSERPVDGVMLASGPYQVSERHHGDILVRTYFTPELAHLTDTYLDRTLGYLERYDRMIGTYPYAAFSIVAAPLPVGLGFPYLTYIGRRVLRLPFIPVTSLPHEVLHSWWGNGVDVDYASGNWAEGLTTYLADYAIKEASGNEGAKQARLRWLRDFASLPDDRDHPLREFISRQHGAGQMVGYNKTAMVFHMLRDRIGDPAFRQGLKQIWRRHRFQVADWDDLRAAFEAASGQDLGLFFTQWLERAGAPHLALDQVAAKAAGNGYEVTFRLSQDRPNYQLRIPVAVGTETGVDYQVVDLDRARGDFRLVTEVRPQWLAVDPDFDLFRRLDITETPPILREAMLASDAQLVIAAEDDDYRAAARRLAERMAEGRLNPVDRADSSQVALLIGTRADLAAHLAGLDAVRPDADETVLAWAGRTQRGSAYVVVEAPDVAALTRLLRPLPHYGSRSLVTFEGGRAVRKEIWPVEGGPLHREISIR